MNAYLITEKTETRPNENLVLARADHREATRLLEREDYAAAEALLRRALAMAPEHGPSLAALAICVAESSGRYLTAEKLALKANKASPREPDGHLALCRINRLGCRPQRARRHLEAARCLAPNDPRLERENAQLRAARQPVLAELPADHPLNRRLGALRDVLLMRLKVSRKGIALEATA